MRKRESRDPSSDVPREVHAGSSRRRFLQGTLCVLGGLLLNQWSVPWLLKINGSLPVWGIAVVWLQQLLWLGLGAGLLFERGSWRVMTNLIAGSRGGKGSRWIASGFLLVTVTGVAAGFYGTLRGTGLVDPHRDMRNSFAHVLASEEWIAARLPDVKALGKSVMNLSLPDRKTRSLFGANVLITKPRFPADMDLKRGEAGSPATPLEGMGVQVADLATDEPSTVDRDALQFWEPVFRDVHYFERAKFKIKDATVVSESPGVVDSLVLFSGVGYSRGGQVIELKAKLKLNWAQAQTGDDPKWVIDRWKTAHMEIITSPRKLFAETLDQAIVDTSVLEAARESIHEQHLTDIGLGRVKKSIIKPLPKASTLYHPSLSVVDLDQDGFDDFYLMARWGKCRFFRNRADGTFEETAETLGLDVDGPISCALFADFDNDGDSDALLGRAHLPCIYLRNEGEHFVDASEDSLPNPNPVLVTSLSAADYDSDGLLDVYLSTYGAHKHKALMSPEDRAIYEKGKVGKHSFLNRFGPPNVLLRNLGNGRFARADVPHIVKRTFQATWSDYDRDGDQDLYVSSDYSPNNLLRNEGNGRFVDVTAETNTEDVGFGMGAAWGDYDNDGWPDLYTTNMYSKAGLRITRKMPGLEDTFSYAAHGNTLFKNRGVSSEERAGKAGQFEKVSGLESPALLVEAGGWGWCGQFVDIDNDGFLDIHALSGYYTAPRKIAQPGDF